MKKSIENITQTIHIKHVFTDKESLELSRKMARAEADINVKMDELKSVTTSIKADIATQEGILHSCAEKLRSGYEMRLKEANVKYQNGIALFTDIDTGELLDERPMTEDEQLRLTGVRTDAEDIIRESGEDE